GAGARSAAELVERIPEGGQAKVAAGGAASPLEPVEVDGEAGVEGCLALEPAQAGQDGGTDRGPESRCGGWREVDGDLERPFALVARPGDGHAANPTGQGRRTLDRCRHRRIGAEAGQGITEVGRPDQADGG